MAKVGIIGGSGLYQIEGLKDMEELTIVDTPFGPPSDHFLSGKIEGTEVFFLARHGRGHHINPTEINYRANIFAMKKFGVDAIISVSAVGSLREDIKPMDFVVPDQFVDRTTKRDCSFFCDGIVAHVSMADPISGEIANILINACKSLGIRVHEKGTYINIEGPQFSTRAESNLYRSWGMDIIGMTNMVEAKLAREAEIAYATLAAVTDYDCWYDGHDNVTVDMVVEYLRKNVDNAKKILAVAVPEIGKLDKFSAQGALSTAIITARDHIKEQKKRELKILLEKYIT